MLLTGKKSSFHRHGSSVAGVKKSQKNIFFKVLILTTGNVVLKKEEMSGYTWILFALIRNYSLCMDLTIPTLGIKILKSIAGRMQSHFSIRIAL